ncbi:MAG TPA: 3-isopropylmalate dehydratase small subunit [Acidimicrobiia bacterium]|nr:3-isopropylmalate dehydratase small subunit [Acidimicrobiia bacterium]
MQPVTVITATIAPLPRANVDTDQIMPKNFLKRVERTGYGEFVFWDWRKDEKDFVLERPEYANAGVLVAGPNFGSGSSREHAPWGLQDWGFEAVVAPSFADIFFNNCTKIGLLPVVLSEKEVQWLLELGQSDPTAEIVIDLQEQSVSYRDEFDARFEIDPFTKHRLLNGLDDIGLTLQHADEIAAFESARPSWKPSLA